MFTFLVVLISLLAIILMLVILLQSGKGGGLAAEFGGASSSTESIMGGRQAATVLTKGTWIGGGVFLFLALILAILSARTTAPPESILRTEFGQTTPASPTSVLETEAQGGLAAPAGASAEEQGAGPGQPGTQETPPPE